MIFYTLFENPVKKQVTSGIGNQILPCQQPVELCIMVDKSAEKINEDSRTVH
jgi:hypothetical protein